MGCWNPTCVISNLPIMYGEKVYAVFLAKMDDPNYKIDNYCYTTFMWRPVGYFFEGEYNDYGRLDKCKGMFNDTFDLIKKYLIEFEEGENKYRDIAVKKDSFTPEVLFNANHEKRLFVKPTWQMELKLVFLKKSIVNNIIHNFPIEAYDYDYENGETTRADIRTIIDDKLKSYKKKFKNLSKIEDKDERRLQEFWLKNKLIDDRVLFEGTQTLGQFHEVHEKIIKSLGNRKEFNRLLKAQKMMVILNSFMEVSRKAWGPQGSEGSQNIETDGQVFLANAIIKEAEAMKNYWDDEL